MFRHPSKNRTFFHNLQLAIILSLVAGIVNITGVLSLKTLTTNVTGHFAYFADAFLNQNYTTAFTFLGFLISFLLGSFTSGFFTELVSKKKPDLAHIIPLLLEISLLISIGYFGSNINLSSTDIKFIAFVMLYSMGLQNSLVTKISKAIVRTTHLTGLFTDLGIELSQLLFQKNKLETQKLKTNIYLRLSIIICFFFGCFIGDLVFDYLEIRTLYVASIILLFALIYDFIRLRFINFKSWK